MKSNKKFLQSVAALLILIFHLWIPVSDWIGEEFIIKIGYVGVDIFFFVSAYSLATRDIEYGKLLKNRILNIYDKYVLFAIIASIVKKMSLIRFLKIVSFIEFFEKGGGSFLWFVPAIMLLYILFPLFIKWKWRYKSLLVLILWLIVSMILEQLTGYTKLFIFTNRIPVMLAGYVLAKELKIPSWIYPVSLLTGLVALYLFGYRLKLNQPIAEFYFIFGTLIAVGLYGISKYIKDRKIWHILSSGTLELYALQMICGAKLAMYIYRYTGYKLLTNVLVIVILVAVAYVIAVVWRKVLDRLSMMLAGRSNVH